MALTDLWDPSRLSGSGLGAVQEFMYTQKITDINIVHSGYVELLCDTGLIGLGLYLLTVGCCLREGWRVYRYNGSHVSRMLALCALGGFPALLFCMGFDNVFSFALVAGNYPFVFTGMAVGLAQSRP
jgi:O-antigen ligase